MISYKLVYHPKPLVNVKIYCIHRYPLALATGREIFGANALRGKLNEGGVQDQI